MASRRSRRGGSRRSSPNRNRNKSGSDSGRGRPPKKSLGAGVSEPEYAESVGNTLEEAIEKALEVLDAREDEVDVEVLEEIKRGFLGIGVRRPYRVRVTWRADSTREILVEDDSLGARAIEFSRDEPVLDEPRRQDRRRREPRRDDRRRGGSEARGSGRDRDDRRDDRESGRRRDSRESSRGRDSRESGRGRDSRESGRRRDTRDSSRGRDTREKGRDREAREQSPNRESRVHAEDRSDTRRERGSRRSSDRRRERPRRREDEPVVEQIREPEIEAAPEPTPPPAAPEPVTVAREEPAVASASETDPELVEEAREATLELIDHLGLEAVVEASAEEDGEIRIDLTSETDEGLLIGKHGETRGALQHVVGRVLSRRRETNVPVILDVAGYWSRRVEKLIQESLRTADRVVERDRELKTELLSPQERRVVHRALLEDDRIATESIGRGLFKRVLVRPRKGE